VTTKEYQNMKTHKQAIRKTLIFSQEWNI